MPPLPPARPLPERVLLISIGSAGDLYPLLGVGRALARRGRAVTLCCTPHFEATVRADGLAFEPLGDAAAYQRVTADPALWRPAGGFRRVTEAASESVERLAGIVDRWLATGPGVVVAPTLGLGARLAHERAAAAGRGFPLLTVHLQPCCLLTSEGPLVTPTGFDLARLPRPARRLANRAVAAWGDRLLRPVEAARRAAGLGVRRRGTSLLFDWMQSPDGVLGLWPAWYAPAPADWPSRLRTTGFVLHDGPGHDDALPSAVDGLIAQRGAPVVFAPGSANRFTGAFFAAALEAGRRLDRPVVLLGGDVSALPSPLPSFAVRLEHAPLSRLLARAAAVVHHGGIGTMARGFAAGLPQLVCPMAHDQPDNAARAGRLGVAATLPWRRITPERMTASLGRLLVDVGAARRAKALASRMTPDAAEVAADVIDAAARGRRPASDID